jgi:hypothetical protein
MSLSELSYKERLQAWCKGDASAYQFIDVVFSTLHVWDDLIDKDKPVTTEQIHRLMVDVLIELPRNRFYLTNFAQLNSILHLAIINWHIANAMELTGDALDAHIAFILRSTYVDLVTTVALIVGGQEWAIDIGLQARRHASSEGFTAYLDALTKEHRSALVQEGT